MAGTPRIMQFGVGYVLSPRIRQAKLSNHVRPPPPRRSLSPLICPVTPHT